LQARVCDAAECGVRRICDVSPGEPSGGNGVSSCVAVCGIIELVAAVRASMCGDVFWVSVHVASVQFGGSAAVCCVSAKMWLRRWWR